MCVALLFLFVYTQGIRDIRQSRIDWLVLMLEPNVREQAVTHIYIHIDGLIAILAQEVG